MNPSTCIMDPYNTRFLLKFKETVLDAITTMVNQSLTTGTFLDDWKVASIRPLIKSPNLDTELKKLQKHFDNQILLPKHQSAYRKQYSTEATLLNMCVKYIENQKCTSVVCLYLSTAFDAVNHKILVDVLKSYFGITEHALAWISSNLSNRKFLVQRGQFTSKVVAITFSVPQGSILGPILFNCYASTLMEIISESNDSVLSGYADDPCHNPLLQPR